ncbi:MAG: xanthine dehydrogenase accessory protein XdhC [Luteolibacter sp.]
MSVFWQQLQTLAESGQDAVVITLIGLRGSVPGELGAKAVVSAQGLQSGTIGGGKIEARAIFLAQELLADSARPVCQTRCWNLQKDIGMTCGGEMTLLFEIHRASPPWRIVIFGAGHVSQALVKVLLPLACQIVVIDTREDWLAKLPVAEKLLPVKVGWIEDGVSQIREKDQILAITQGHSTDFPVLRDVFLSRRDVSFIGVIGSQAKRAVLLKNLRQTGVDEALLQTLVCPLGLPLGGNDPAEIAISIAAQLLERRG